MRLVDIHIDGFGKLVNRSFSFGDGITVVFGLNEQGKSTLYTCIKAVLYGLRREKGRASGNDTWSRFRPWDGSPYRASLKVEHQGIIYRIERDFDKDPTGVKLSDDASGVPMPDAQILLDEMLAGMSETAFEHTVSIGQLGVGDFAPSVTGAGSKGDSGAKAVDEFKRYIQSVGSTRDRALSAQRATEYLKKQRRELEESIAPEAAKAYVNNVSEIRSLEKTLEDPKYADHMDMIEESIEKNADKFGAVPFDGKEDLEFYRTSLKSVYDKFSRSKRELESGDIAKAKVRAIVLCVLGALMAAAGAWLSVSMADAGGGKTLGIFGSGQTAVLYTTSSSVPKNLPMILMIAGTVILAAAIVMLILNARARRSATECLMEERDIVLQYTKRLGVDNTDEADFKSVMGKLDGYAEALALREDVTREHELQEELSQLTRRLRELKEDNASLKTQIAMNESVNEEISAVELALETIEHLTARMQKSFAVFLNKDASDYIVGITGGAYDSMYIDEDMNIFMNTDGKMIPVENISTGARDQVYLAIRLAMARVIEDGADSMPLIFDDSFVNYDDDRLKAALGWMAKEYKGQLILFTCQRREESILEQIGAEYTAVKI